MTKGRSKKYKGQEPSTSQPAYHSNVKKIKKRYLKKKKSKRKMLIPHMSLFRHLGPPKMVHMLDVQLPPLSLFL
ncbi:hypothetical protein SLEP1_g9526 [Rubroshorea leprosula]|uniref:Uncharacterized protein n=1 Tax=Rubroshorea leprosula TaxID=152421 RepID=A0AAV5I568_9ROSI|nr:hypothetical protein SLEP1_g9526 [Rubroshorea leprosula]